MPKVPSAGMIGPTSSVGSSPLLDKPSEAQLLMATAALSQQSGQGGTSRRETALQRKTKAPKLGK